MIVIPRSDFSDRDSEKDYQLREEILSYLSDVAYTAGDLSGSEIRGPGWKFQEWSLSYRITTDDKQHEVFLALKYGVR